MLLFVTVGGSFLALVYILYYHLLHQRSESIEPKKTTCETEAETLEKEKKEISEKVENLSKDESVKTEEPSFQSFDQEQNDTSNNNELSKDEISVEEEIIQLDKVRETESAVNIIFENLTKHESEDEFLDESTDSTRNNLLIIENEDVHCVEKVVERDIKRSSPEIDEDKLNTSIQLENEVMCIDKPTDESDSVEDSFNEGCTKMTDVIFEELGLEKTFNKEKVVFEWNYEGDAVFVTGSFNAWSEQLPLTKNDDGVFRLETKLSHGHHEYKYIVDGDWKTAPEQNVSGLNNVMEI